MTLFASFFAAAADSDSTSENLTLNALPSTSFMDAAKAFAEQFGFTLTDEGRRETSSRFTLVQSFGIEGHVQRLFVWSAK